MPISGMNHFTVLTDNLEATTSFYEALGLQIGNRPDFDFPGAWLYAGGQPVLHVIAGRKLPPDPRGVLDHMAFSARDLAGVVSRLTERGVRYDLRRVPSVGAWQLFCFDPNGARVELDFEATEAAP
jgi:catechol 2,3-dioxygenase-like lactoylglutathione lyase family enzyme